MFGSPVEGGGYDHTSWIRRSVPCYPADLPRELDGGIPELTEAQLREQKETEQVDKHPPAQQNVGDDGLARMFPKPARNPRPGGGLRPRLHFHRHFLVQRVSRTFIL